MEESKMTEYLVLLGFSVKLFQAMNAVMAS